MLGHRGAYGGYGYGQYAMRAAYGPASLAQEGDHDLVDVERIEAHGCRDDVDDGIDGSHLVKVDLFRRGTVRLRLRLGQNLEHALGREPCAPGQRAGVDDCKDIGQTAMLMVVMRAMCAFVLMMVAMLAFVLMAVGRLFVMRMGGEFAPTMSVVMLVLVVVVIAAVHACALVLVGMFVLMRVGVVVVVSGIIGPFVLVLMRMGGRGAAFKMAVQPRHVVVMVFQLSLEPHVEVAGAHAVLCHLTHDDLVPRERQIRERLAQVLLVGSQIEQGCDDHIAADARCTFEIEGLSHEVVLSSSEMTYR